MARNMLKIAANFMQDKAEAHMSEEVEYEIPGVGVGTVTAILGGTEYEMDSGSGFVGRVIRADFIIRKSGLLVNELVYEPARNHIIRYTYDDGNVYEGRVLPEGEIPHCKDSDPYGVAWRIHTKRDN